MVILNIVRWRVKILHHNPVYYFGCILYINLVKIPHTTGKLKTGPRALTPNTLTAGNLFHFLPLNQRLPPHGHSSPMGDPAGCHIMHS